MKIAIIGSRGIPAHYGGFETFTAFLARGLFGKGHEITVVNDRNHPPDPGKFPGIRIINSRFSKEKNPVLFYRDSIRRVRDDNHVVLVCGVGGAFFYGTKRGRKVPIVTNVDGLEHLRGKYTRIKKLYVRFAQKAAWRKSDAIVCDASGIAEYWKKAFHTPESGVFVIRYGVEIPPEVNRKIPEDIPVEKNDYYLVVSRFVPENHLQEIVSGYQLSGTKKKLVVTGDPDGSGYSLKLIASASDEIIFTGGIYEHEKLTALRQHAFSYIHGHSVGGTNPSLLESMAVSGICICHDNIFNRETTGDGQLYFKSPEALSAVIKSLESAGGETIAALKRNAMDTVINNFQWERIVDSYDQLFRNICHEH
ncbi:MAG: DUF1972 domain-containing protein [Bacteroidia bacterium]|nr:DUF1972 domain-containing protein [Bacteroidia bacterium]